MEKNGIVGIMTFHAAHNYGSVLQAYATQRLISNLGYESEIINYRLPNQKQFYNALYSTRFGLKPFLRRIMRLPEHKARVIRRNKFEEFITQELTLSNKEISEYDGLKEYHDKYSVLITGSDQVWNEHCTAEFKTEPEESILGYYLAFADDNIARISFSSSFGGMKKNEVEKYVPFLSKYSFLAVREEDGATMLSELLSGRKVENTLDPTLVLDREEWKSLCTKGHADRYILVYTLRQYNAAKELLAHVRRLARRHNLKIKIISPFCANFDKDIEIAIDSGPDEFISLIRDAELVITDSFHGTAFSINMSTPFYVIEHSKDNRKGLLLKKIGLENRMIHSYEELEAVDSYTMDYTRAYDLLEQERERSIQYLKESLKEVMVDGGHMPSK